MPTTVPKIVSRFLMFVVLPVVFIAFISKQFGFGYVPATISDSIVYLFHLAASGIGGWCIGLWAAESLKKQ